MLHDTVDETCHTDSGTLREYLTRRDAQSFESNLEWDFNRGNLIRQLVRIRFQFLCIGRAHDPCEVILFHLYGMKHFFQSRKCSLERTIIIRLAILLLIREGFHKFPDGLLFALMNQKVLIACMQCLADISRIVIFPESGTLRIQLIELELASARTECSER